MRIPRIHHPATLAAGLSVELGDSAANHVARVLSLPAGAPLILFDGTGGECEAVVETIDTRRVVARVLAHHAHEREAPHEHKHAQDNTRTERKENTEQKPAEHGVNRIVPLFTERCGVQLTGE